jgi:flagellar protein FlaJ
MLAQPDKFRSFRRLVGLSGLFSQRARWLKSDLPRVGVDVLPQIYLLACFFNAVFWGLAVSGLLLFLLSRQQDKIPWNTIVLSGAAIFITFLFLFLYYPRILVQKRAGQIDRRLAFALKDLLLQVSSGVCLFNGMTNVSKAGYDEISDEFDKVVREINAGVNEVDALERMGLRTESRFVKKTIWQLVNVMRSGSSVAGALRSVVGSLILFEQKLIRDFTQELNLWSLVYMIFAVIAPTLGTTMLIILSAFGGAGVSKELFIAVLIVSFFAQASIVGFVKNRRPVINA